MLLPLSLSCGPDPSAVSLAARALPGQQLAERFQHHINPLVRVSVDPLAIVQNEPSISCNPGRSGNLLVSMNDYHQPGVLQSAGTVYTSFDGGNNFQYRGLLPGLTVQSGGSFEGAGNTAVACGADGRCYYTALVYDRSSARSGIAVGHSEDGGASFSAALTVAGDGSAAVLHDKPWIAVDGSAGRYAGRAYVTWTRFALSGTGAVVSSPIWLSRSADHGASFDAGRQVSPAPFDQGQASASVVDRRGRLYMAYQYYPLDVPGSQHVIQWSEDGGDTFTTPRKVSDVVELPQPLPGAHYRTNSFPSLAVNPERDVLLLSWADYGGGVADVLVSASFDRGATWTAPRKVNDNQVQAQQAFPSVACGGGSCGVSFYSTRDDPGGARLSYYYAMLRLLPDRRIEPGGNQRVSEALVDPEAQLSGQYIGDYTGLCLDRGGAHPVWTGTRAVTEKGSTTVHQEVYTARVPALR